MARRFLPFSIDHSLSAGNGPGLLRIDSNGVQTGRLLFFVSAGGSGQGQLNPIRKPFLHLDLGGCAVACGHEIAAYRHVGDGKVLVPQIVWAGAVTGIRRGAVGNLAGVEVGDDDFQAIHGVAACESDPPGDHTGAGVRRKPQIGVAHTAVGVAIQAHLEVQVRPARVACRTDQPDDLPGYHPLAGLDEDLRQVGIQCVELLALVADIVPDGDDVAVAGDGFFAVAVAPASDFHNAVSDGDDLRADRVGDVDAVMDAKFLG